MSNTSNFIIKYGVLEEYVGSDENVVVPQGVSVVGSNAFCSHTAVKTVHLPQSVKEIKKWAFLGCKTLESVELPVGLTEIGERAFCNCISLKHIEIPIGVRKIDDEAFYKCVSLKEIIIPKTVETLGKHVFRECSGLKTVKLDEKFNKTGYFTFEQCDGLADEKGFIVIDGKMHDYVGKCKTAVIPESVKQILAPSVDRYITIKELTITDNVEKIDKKAFYNYRSLKNIEIVCDNNTDIFYNVYMAFPPSKKAMLFDLYLKKYYEKVSKNAKTTRVLKANRNKIINLATKADDVELVDKLFSLYKKIPLSDLNKMIEKTKTSGIVYAYLLDYKAKHYSVMDQEKYEADEFDKSIGLKPRTVADWKRIFGLFEYKNGWGIRSYLADESEVIIPERIGKKKVIAIGTGCFSNGLGAQLSRENHIKDVVLPNGLTEIMSGAFYKCSDMEFIYIPSTVTKIDRNVFSGCDKLTILGERDSLAEIYAKENKIKFIEKYIETE